MYNMILKLAKWQIAFQKVTCCFDKIYLITMSEFASTSALPNTECQEVLSAFSCFFQKLNEIEWLSQSTKEEIKSCLQSARNIEKISETLKSNGSFEDFVILLPNMYGHSFEQIYKACDIVFTMVLTASGIPLPCVKTCIDEYHKLCGSERFENILASVIFSSEIYRILLDYIATSSEDDLESNRISLQSHLFRNSWKSESDVKILKNKFYKWLRTDTSGKNIAVAMQVVCSDASNSHVSFCLVNSLVKVLQERGDTATLFWKIFSEFPNVRKALSKSTDLVCGVLEFFKTTAKWMEATASFHWVSREEGPCKVFGFEDLINGINSMLEIDESVHNMVDQFLSERRNSEGCTFWDDVEIQLLKRQIGFNSVFE